MKLLLKGIYISMLVLLVGCSSEESLEKIVKGDNKLTIIVKDSLEDLDLEEEEEIIPPAEAPDQGELTNKEIEAELLAIRAIWSADRNAMSDGQYTLTTVANGSEVYSSNGEIKIIEVKANINGIDHARIYNFSQGRLIFAFLNGSDAHRLYYKDNTLFRWSYTADASKGDQVVSHDNRTDLQGFNQWGSFAKNEADQLYLEALSGIQ